MYKIICLLKPFDLNQKFYLYEGNNPVAERDVPMEDVKGTLFSMVDEYKDIEFISLIGPKQYANGIKRQIKEYELEKYSKNSLNIIIQ